jgi:hypothetical protein
MTPEQRERLETRLTNVLRKKHPGPLTQVRISDDGKTAALFVDGKNVRKRPVLKRYGSFYLGELDT